MQFYTFVAHHDDFYLYKIPRSLQNITKFKVIYESKSAKARVDIDTNGLTMNTGNRRGEERMLGYEAYTYTMLSLRFYPTDRSLISSW